MPRPVPERYIATPQDVLHALRNRNPDPGGHGNAPQTEFTIAAQIVAERRITRHGAILDNVIDRDKLVQLLEEMASDGRLVGKPNTEWAALHRTPPSRSSIPLYVTPEKAREWGIEEKARPVKARWTLTVVFDDLKTQTTADPELTFPHDECSSLIGFLGDHWGLLPEEVQEIAEWTSTRMVLQLESLEFVSTVTNWLGFHAVPQSITITRNEDR